MNLTLSEQILKLLQELPPSEIERRLQHTSGPGWRFLQVTVAPLARPETEILRVGQALENAKEIECMAGTLSSLREPIRIARRGQKHLENLAIQELQEKQEREEVRKKRRLDKLEQLRKYEADTPLVTPEPVTKTELITRATDGQFFYGKTAIQFTNEPQRIFELAYEENGEWICSQNNLAWTENERQVFTTIRKQLCAAGADPKLVFEMGRKSKRKPGRYRINPEFLSQVFKK